jgi:ribosome-binding factor A
LRRQEGGRAGPPLHEDGRQLKNTNRKVNETAAQEVATILLFDVADPRLRLVTVTGAEVSRDRSVMEVYVSADADFYDDVSAGLESAKGRIRRLLGERLSWRVTPELRFKIDIGADAAERISEILSDERARGTGGAGGEGPGEEPGEEPGEGLS